MLLRKAKAGDDPGATERRRMLLAVKAGLICADSAASALEREGRTFAWINQTANDTSVTGEEIASKIIEPRMAQVAKEKGRPFELHAFQRLAGRQGPRALLRAACGTGKTLISLGSMYVHSKGRPFTALVMVPPQLTMKWCRECR